MKQAQEIRSGNVITVGNDAMVVLKAEFNKSGRNASVMKMKLKNLLTGSMSESGLQGRRQVRTDRPRTQGCDLLLFRRPHVRLHGRRVQPVRDGQGEHGRRTQLPRRRHAGRDRLLPGAARSRSRSRHSVVREITYTEPAVRGDTSGKVLKPATITTGYKVPRSAVLRDRRQDRDRHPHRGVPEARDGVIEGERPPGRRRVTGKSSHHEAAAAAPASTVPLARSPAPMMARGLLVVSRLPRTWRCIQRVGRAVRAGPTFGAHGAPYKAAW